MFKPSSSVSSIYPVTTERKTSMHWYSLAYMMASPQLAHVIIDYAFISTSVNPIITKLHRKKDQHAMILLYR